MNRRFLTVALTLPLVAGACGTTSSPAPAHTFAERATAGIQAGDEHNDTDVMFLQMLAHHQRQGLEMTGTALKRTRDPELRTLARAVQATETDELTMMESWLTGWGESTDADPEPDRHADHGGLPGTGPAEIKALTTVPATSFDSAFVNLFLAHQHNAVEMAHLETGNGHNREAKQFAERVRESRQGEIQQMLKLMND